MSGTGVPPSTATLGFRLRPPPPPLLALARLRGLSVAEESSSLGFFNDEGVLVLEGESTGLGGESFKVILSGEDIINSKKVARREQKPAFVSSQFFTPRFKITHTSQILNQMSYLLCTKCLL